MSFVATVHYHNLEVWIDCRLCRDTSELSDGILDGNNTKMQAVVRKCK